MCDLLYIIVPEPTNKIFIVVDSGRYYGMFKSLIETKYLLYEVILLYRIKWIKWQKWRTLNNLDFLYNIQKYIDYNKTTNFLYNGVNVSLSYERAQNWLQNITFVEIF